MNPALIDYYYRRGGGGQSFPAISGEGSFVMNDIPQESLTPELYYSYSVPEGSNLPLLVYFHGWDGGGGIVGGIDPQAITDLNALGIGILGVGMRGRNTGVAYASVTADREEYRDANALELYDAKATIDYFIASVAPEGHISATKLIGYGISGGGGNMFGLTTKFPGLFSIAIIFYGIGKMGTYTGDPSVYTGWYSDNVGFQSGIQLAVGGAPLLNGAVDSYFLSRDNIRGGRNVQCKIYIFHDSGDGTVKVDHSDLFEDELIAYSKTYVYDRSTDGTWAHGNADLLVGMYVDTASLSWLTDALALTKPTLPTSGTIHVAGYHIRDDFQLWIKKYRLNLTATPKAQAYPNQGKSYALTCTYNTATSTYEITPIIPSTSDQFFFTEITQGTDSVTAIVAALDTVTLKPTTWALSPYDLAYDWKYYINFGNSDYYLLDDASKVSNAWDLTGNNNFVFQQTRATRASIVDGSLDNGVLGLAGTSGVLAANYNDLTLTGEFTIVFSCDPDAATVASLSGNIIGKGAGSKSLIQFGTFSGKVQISFNTESNVFIGNATPANSDVGKQVWVVRRDGSNAVVATCKNSSGTYSYTVGTSAGSFIPKMLGAGTAATKQFSGKIYMAAACLGRFSDTDVTTFVDAEYARIAAL